MTECNHEISDEDYEILAGHPDVMILDDDILSPYDQPQRRDSQNRLFQPSRDLLAMKVSEHFGHLGGVCYASDTGVQYLHKIRIRSH